MADYETLSDYSRDSHGNPMPRRRSFLVLNRTFEIEDINDLNNTIIIDEKNSDLLEKDKPEEFDLNDQHFFV